MNPLFWVVMGAAAIATNAGSTLILTEPDLPFLLAMRPFVNGTTLILWAWATWWIPLLAIFGVWRHVVRRYPLVYAPMYWSLVFPLGMYAVAHLPTLARLRLPPDRDLLAGDGLDRARRVGRDDARSARVRASAPASRPPCHGMTSPGWPATAP